MTSKKFYNVKWDETAMNDIINFGVIKQGTNAQLFFVIYLDDFEFDDIQQFNTFLTVLETKKEKTFLNISDFEIDIWKQLIYHRNKWISRHFEAFINYVKDHEFQT